MALNIFETPKHYTIIHHFRDILIILISLATSFSLISSFGAFYTVSGFELRFEIELFGLFLIGIYFGTIGKDVSDKFNMREQVNVVRMIIVLALAFAIFANFFDSFPINGSIILVSIGLIVIWIYY